MICSFPGNEAFGDRLRTLLNRPSAELEWRRFPDGESYVRFRQNVRGSDLAIACTLNDPDTKILALLFAAHTARELGAARVGLIAPYLGYMRQDRRFHEGEALTSMHFARLLSEAFDWLVTVDPHLHRYHSLGDIYNIPSAAVPAAPALAEWIAVNVERPLIIGPDSESEQWVREVARDCDAPYTVMRKIRLGDRRVEIEVPSLAPWQGRVPVLLDDIISSARTMAIAATRVQEAGLGPPVCVAVHALFSSDAMPALRQANASRVVTTNTVRHETNEIDVAALVAGGVRAVEEGEHAASRP